MTGEFDEVSYDGTTLLPNAVTYTGLSSNGDDGMFRSFDYDGNEVLIQNYLALPGDANGDGTVDGADFLAFNNGKFAPGNWTTGDFTGDGFVDGADFLVWNNNKFTSADISNRFTFDPATVPEPSGLLLISLLLLVAPNLRKKS